MHKLIGIFGGTFDPVHYGHLRTALEIMQAAKLDEVRFIPNRYPPHREPPLLNDQQRAELVQLAIADMPGFVLDRRELQREGPSYMVDTLNSLKADEADCALCLMMGMDAFAGLTRWHRWQRLFELAHLIVMTRPGVDLPECAQQAEIQPRLTDDVCHLQQGTEGQILLQSVTQLDISASLIRQQLSMQRSTRFLLPDVVREKLEQAYAR